MDSDIKTTIVDVRFPSQNRAYVRSFGQDDDGAIEFALSALDHMRTGAGSVECLQLLLPVDLEAQARTGVWINDRTGLPE